MKEQHIKRGVAGGVRGAASSGSRFQIAEKLKEN
jgi:hypothetical protein